MHHIPYLLTKQCIIYHIYFPGNASCSISTSQVMLCIPYLFPKQCIIYYIYFLRITSYTLSTYQTMHHIPYLVESKMRFSLNLVFKYVRSSEISAWCAKLNHSERDHLEPDQSVHCQIIRFFWDVVQHSGSSLLMLLNNRSAHRQVSRNPKERTAQLKLPFFFYFVHLIF